MFNFYNCIIYLITLSGFVYYETDCFHQLRNPFIPLDVEDPTLYQVNYLPGLINKLLFIIYQEYQRNLIGEGKEEREAVSKEHGKPFDKIWKKKKLKKEDYEALEKYYGLICEDISSQRARVGGDWAVAGCVIQKHQRDLIR